MFSVLNEAVNRLMDGFFQQQEENRRLHKRCDDLQTELREMQARLATEREELERRIEASSKSFENLTFDFVLVGFIYNDDSMETPIFIKKQSGCSVFQALCNDALGADVCSYNFSLNFESFRYFDPIFDLAEWSEVDYLSVQYEDKYLYQGYSESVELLMLNPTQGLKNLYKTCKDLGIKFVVNGSDSFNGGSIDNLLS